MILIHQIWIFWDGHSVKCHWWHLVEWSTRLIVVARYGLRNRDTQDFLACVMSDADAYSTFWKILNEPEWQDHSECENVSAFELNSNVPDYLLYLCHFLGQESLKGGDPVDMKMAPFRLHIFLSVPNIPKCWRLIRKQTVFKIGIF